MHEVTRAVTLGIVKIMTGTLIIYEPRPNNNQEPLIPKGRTITVTQTSVLLEAILIG